MRRIDINADLGEGGPADAELMKIVSSCSIACGGHAGNPDSMTATLELARAAGVAAGAHPSYPDRAGFGRRAKFLEGPPLERSLGDQVQQLVTLAEAAGHTLGHLKPHGALYHDANADARLAGFLETLAERFGLALVGPPAGELQLAAEASGLDYVGEGFADRAYDVDGRLVPRGQSGAVFEQPQQAVRQALSLALHQKTCALDGTEVAMRVDTLCLHGDTPGALALAAAVRSALLDNGVAIRAYNA